MVNKADELFKKGKLEESLALYNKISKFEEFLTFHNLGVTALKEQKYQEALGYFEQSIQSGQNQCVASINAAVSALHLNDIELFNHYINIAYNYLPSCSKDPLYDYYYSLVMFYKQKYIEALVVLKNKPVD